MDPSQPDPAVAGTLLAEHQPPRAEPTLEGARELVRWTANLPLRVRWSGEQLRDGYCRRSPREVLRDGQMAFTAPCADLCGVAALALDQAGFRATLVLGGIRRPLQGVKFQTGLELELEGETWVVGFGVSSTYFYRGTFVETSRRPLVLRERPDRLDPDAPFLEWFGFGGLDGMKGWLSGYDLERDHRLHIRQNGWLRYRLARRKAGSPSRALRKGRLPGAPGRWA